MVEVTEDVIIRLKAHAESQRYQKATASQSQHQNNTTEPAVPMDLVPRPNNYVLSYGSKGETTIETISALEMRKQKEGELRENDKFWEEKLRDIESRYERSEITLDQEFHKKLTQVSALVPRNKEQKCIDMSMNVAECYKTYPNQVLKCSEVVKEFAKCVEKESTLT